MSKLVTGTNFGIKSVVNNLWAKNMTMNSIGYGMGQLGGGFSYTAVPKLSVGKISTTGLDDGTEGIVSYDICEKADAYIGQINMLTASSFCGLNGALWGYDFVKNFDSSTINPLFKYTPDEESLKDQRNVFFLIIYFIFRFCI